MTDAWSKINPANYTIFGKHSEYILVSDFNMGNNIYSITALKEYAQNTEILHLRQRAVR